MYLKENYYEFEEKIGKLIIESKYGIFYVTFDKEDYDLIKKYQWRVSKKKEKFYACTGQNRDGKKILYFSNISQSLIILYLYSSKILCTKLVFPVPGKPQIINFIINLNKNISYKLIKTK